MRRAYPKNRTWLCQREIRPAAGWAACALTLGCFAFTPVPYAQADESDNACCRDLEQRITELERLNARKSKAALDLRISGSINRAVMFWDDGGAQGQAVVTNDNDNSTFTVEGENGNIGQGWKLGFIIDIDVLTAASSDVSQRAKGAAVDIEPGELSLWLGNERFGKLSLGQSSSKGASGGANENDLSGTTVASYVGVADVGGNFLLRRAGARPGDGLLAITWSDVINSLDEPDGNIIAYQSPELAGFSASGLWGEDDVWDAGLQYQAKSLGIFQIATAATINKNLQGEREGLADYQTLSGSASILHLPSGLSATVAGGQRQFFQRNSSAPDGSDALFGYLKLGWRTQINPLGDTAFYADYGRFKNFLGHANSETNALGDVAGLGVGTVCGQPPSPCTIADSDAAIAGAGIVQHIEGAGAQLYLGARHHAADVGLASSTGARIPAAALSGFDVIIGGLQFEF